MFCSKCGTENNGDSRFCRNCGAPLTHVDGEAQQQMVQEPQVGQEQWVIQNQAQQQPIINTQSDTQPKPKKNKKALIIVVVAALVLVAAGGIGLKLYNDHQKQVEQDKQNQWDAYVEKVNDWQEDMNNRKLNYLVSEEDETSYQELCDAIQEAIDLHKSTETIDKQKEEVESFLQSMEDSSLEQINNKKAELEETEIEFALDSDLEAIDTYKTDVQNYLDDKNYTEAWKVLEQWEETVSLANSDFDSYNVAVRQYDLSDYPNIKMYVEVTDQDGNFVDNLGSTAFFVNEGRSLDEELNRTTLTSAAKLNQNEGISIGLVADVSGSMSDFMGETQDAMINFTESMQFDKGDEMEITAFNEEAYICQSFTNDASQLTNSINSMVAGGETRLYDTLINEIARIQSCDNAKCVIGFTDGIDNLSVYTPEDVIDAAVSNHIPLFLIGIGSSCDSDTLQYIAESTGGMYQNIDDVESLSDIYNSIYTEQKDVYLLEYTVSEEDDFNDPCYTDIYVRNEDGNGGCLNSFSFEPMDYFRIMYNKFLVAGIDCQTKGERNLLDSGIIITTDDAYKNDKCIAHQSQAAINSGGVGSKDSSIFEVLVGYDVTNVVKEGDTYVVYGMSSYDISKERKLSKANKAEKEYVEEYYGDVEKDTMFWFEENIVNYEKLTMIKDSDGKWKFYTREYEREDGGDAIYVNEVYQAVEE